ncbi:S26 family signal peptidase [Hyphomonas sp. BRH_c22]|uniref:S26 family signal peptidase n=1 Tax=Hyphomonas sp. BRH_c22 TaxID=1629710 RepID=UPI000A3EEF21|nr:S26 family signal peptidase [Hyphomonas sp. BRH_c22]
MSLRAVFWSGISVLGVALTGLPATGVLPPILLYNPSESAPLGWYRVEPLKVISRGDLVVSNLPEAASRLAIQRRYLASGIPVIKTVRALEGDTVCAVDGVLFINGTPTVRLLSEDSLGRALPSPWKACRLLHAGDVLLLSERTPDSFDGRYFGTVRESDIIGRAVRMGDAGEQQTEAFSVEIGGRTECKIKAHGANEGLSPCLHIDFYGSTDKRAALWFDGNLNDGNRLVWFHTHNLACFPPEQPE